MKKFFNRQGLFIATALVLGLFLNQSNCTSDPYCDPDPLYGGCPSTCEQGSTLQWLTRSFGLLLLLNFGSFLGKYNLMTNEESLKEFLKDGKFRQTIEDLNEEWVLKDKQTAKENKIFLKNFAKLTKNKTNTINNKDVNSLG